MQTEQLAKILTGSWQDELKKLPKYQREALVKSWKIMSKIDRLKFGIINIKQLQKEYEAIIPKKPTQQEIYLKLMEIFSRCEPKPDISKATKYIQSLLK